MAAPYAAWPGSGPNAATDATLSTAPRRRSTMPGRNLLHRSTTAATSTSTRLTSCSGTDFATQSESRQPGVVDQDVRSQSECGDPVRQGRPFGSVGQVGGQRVRVRSQPCGELFEAVGAAGYQHYLIAAPRQYCGELLADTRRCAGDDGGAVISWRWESHAVTVTLGLLATLGEHREVVHRLAQHLGRRRTSLLHPLRVGQRGEIVGVGDVGQCRVDLAELPAPQMAGRRPTGFCWTPRDLGGLR